MNVQNNHFTELTVVAEWQGEIDQLMRFFDYKHLTVPELRDVSKEFAELAVKMANHLPPSLETYFGLRNLLIAKDACVRAVVDRDWSKE